MYNHSFHLVVGPYGRVTAVEEQTSFSQVLTFDRQPTVEEGRSLYHVAAWATDTILPLLLRLLI